MIDQKSIEHIAKLAKLELTNHEKQQFQEQLSKVIQHFQEIASVDTVGVEPLTTPTDIQIYLRPDVVDKAVSTEELLKNAPERAGQLLKVPPVV